MVNIPSYIKGLKFIDTKLVVYVAGETSAIPEFPPFGGFHSYHLESRNGAKLGMEDVHRPPHTWMEAKHLDGRCSMQTPEKLS